MNKRFAAFVVTAVVLPFGKAFADDASTVAVSVDNGASNLTNVQSNITALIKSNMESYAAAAVSVTGINSCLAVDTATPQQLAQRCDQWLNNNNGNSPEELLFESVPAPITLDMHMPAENTKHVETIAAKLNLPVKPLRRHVTNHDLPTSKFKIGNLANAIADVAKDNAAKPQGRATAVGLLVIGGGIAINSAIHSYNHKDLSVTLFKVSLVKSGGFDPFEYCQYNRSQCGLILNPMRNSSPSGFTYSLTGTYPYFHDGQRYTPR